jgi:hypothetical protein
LLAAPCRAIPRHGRPLRRQVCELGHSYTKSVAATAALAPGHKQQAQTPFERNLSIRTTCYLLHINMAFEGVNPVIAPNVVTANTFNINPRIDVNAGQRADIRYR